LYLLASAVNLVGDCARSAKLVDADDTVDVEVILPASGGGLVLAVAAVGVICPPLYNSTSGEDDRCIFSLNHNNTCLTI